MSDDIRDVVSTHERDKVNLWKPEVNDNAVEFYETTKEERKITNILLKKIAAKLAPEYGLTDRDFIIRLCFEPGHKVEMKPGNIIRIYFSVLPFDDEFDTIIRRTLHRARMVKRSKAVESWHIMNELGKWSTKLAPKNKFDIKKEETEVEVFYKVTVKHRATGLMVTREGLVSKNTVTKLVAQAREELIDVFEAAQPLLQKNEEPTGATRKSILKDWEKKDETAGDFPIVALGEHLHKIDDFDMQLHSDESLGITEYDDKI